MSEAGEKMVQAFLFPIPGQGHINPILQFGKRLAAKGIRVTLVTTIFHSKTMVAGRIGPISIQAISDGFDDGFKMEGAKMGNYFETFKAVGSRTLFELIQKLSSPECPVTCLVYDSHLYWALDVAKRCGLVAASFFTQSLVVDLVYYNVYKGRLDAPPSVDTISLPGLPPLNHSDLPSFVLDPNQVLPGVIYFLTDQFINLDDTDFVITTSFQALESEALNWMRTEWKRVLAIGPTIPSMYLDKQLEDDKDYGLSFWKKEEEVCRNWLQDKEPGSVVYISFGSMAKLSAEQTEEIAMALKDSNCYFLWVVRASEESTLPPGFSEEVAASGKGLMVNWAHQLEVLTNEAVGCFVTHCGWNSTMEALMLGVPMVAFPCWSDQPTNAKYIEEVWEVGVRVRAGEKGLVGREEVVRCIGEIMEKERRETVLAKAGKWRELGAQALMKVRMGSGRGSFGKRRTSVGSKENSSPKLEVGVSKINQPMGKKVTKSANRPKRQTAVGEAKKFFNEPHPVSPKSLQATTTPEMKLVQSVDKINLQLFPMNGNIRKGLKKDGHNPHLELVLSRQKKIASVLKHLNTKWGNSSIALGQLVLFPYDAQVEEALTMHRRWSSEDTESTAADVYAVVGSPDVFRLRYCWLANDNSQSQLADASFNCNPHLGESREHDFIESLEKVKDTDTENRVASTDIAPTLSADTGVGTRNGNFLTQSFGAWVDCLTNMSMGQFIGETADANKLILEASKADLSSRQMLSTCDSFDAAISAHIRRYQNSGAINYVPHMSVLDAENTCHAFPVKKIGNSKELPSESSPSSFTEMIKEQSTSVPFSSSGRQDLAIVQEDPSESQPHSIVSDSLQNSPKLSDLSWNESSLGCFDPYLFSPSRKIISGDSFSHSNFFVSSRDAMQNFTHPSADGKVIDLNKDQ